MNSFKYIAVATPRHYTLIQRAADKLNHKTQAIQGLSYEYHNWESLEDLGFHSYVDQKKKNQPNLKWI